jgi:hypothetical protein
LCLGEVHDPPKGMVVSPDSECHAFEIRAEMGDGPDDS